VVGDACCAEGGRALSLVAAGSATAAVATSEAATSTTPRTCEGTSSPRRRQVDEGGSRGREAAAAAVAAEVTAGGGCVLAPRKAALLASAALSRAASTTPTGSAGGSAASISVPPMARGRASCRPACGVAAAGRGGLAGLLDPAGAGWLSQRSERPRTSDDSWHCCAAVRRNTCGNTAFGTVISRPDRLSFVPGAVRAVERKQ
jgi:hypothetical protein